MINDQLIVYKNISQDDVVLKCLSFIDDASIDESEFIASLLVLAEKYELHGQLFQSLLTHLLAYHENTFTLALERKKDISVSLKKVKEKIANLQKEKQELVNLNLSYSLLKCFIKH